MVRPMKTTIDIIRAACCADPTFTPERTKAVIAAANGEGTWEVMTNSEPPPRSYSPAQVAALLGVSRRTVGAYCRRGLLVPIYSGATGKRAQSYTGDSVTALLSGKAKNEKEVTA